MGAESVEGFTGKLTRERKNPLLPGGFLRAGDQIRTGDPHLGKVMLYH